MVAKILAVIIAAGVVGVGAVAYHHHTGCCPFGCDNSSPAVEPTPAPTEATTTAPAHSCCQDPTRSAAISLSQSEGCCCEGEPAVKTEVLAIQPREVK